MKNWTRNRIGALLSTLLVLPVLVVVPAVAQGPETAGAEAAQAQDVSAGGPEAVAVAAAREWLALVDAGSYTDSWEMAATLFRNAVTRDRWEQAVSGVRVPLGAVVARDLESARNMTSLPGAPDGNYVVIEFATVFENKAFAIETVTPMLEGDGSWRVSGYFIK